MCDFILNGNSLEKCEKSIDPLNVGKYGVGTWRPASAVFIKRSVISTTIVVQK